MKEWYMKLDLHFLQFPRHLPNDLEGFIYFYPRKFPQIVKAYTEAAKKVCIDPKEFEKLGNIHHDELFAGFEKIKKDYDKGDQKDLAFLVDIDARLHKLYCFRFWVVNYLFSDGPLHEYYIDKIKYYSRRLVEVGDLDVEDFEAQISQVQRNLMQSDYADLYLLNALNGVKLMQVLRDKKMHKLINDVKKLIEKQDKKENSKIFKLLDPVIDEAYEKKNNFGKKLAKALEIMIEQAEFRKTRMPIYNMIIHAIEFEKENLDLDKRHDQMTKRIKELLNLAQKKFTKDEYEELKISYQMARNFIKYKDVMGSIDPLLLPFWFKLLGQIYRVLKKTNKNFAVPPSSFGPGGMFYALGWYLPDDLKVKVYNPDFKEFSLKNL